MSNTKVNKRIESSKKYMDELSKNYSKVNLVRVDLSYKKPYSNNTTLEDANKDLNHMLNNMRSKPSIFENKVGYMGKCEYTEDKGVHFHLMFIFDGQKVQKDAYMATQIGEYWKQITKDKGIYHNCNRNKYPYDGIGMLDHRDRQKRTILDERVIPYLCKEEQDIEPISNSKRVKAFTRGTLPKSKGNKGRPRVEE